MMNVWDLIQSDFSGPCGLEKVRATKQFILGLSTEEKKRFALALLNIICDPVHGFNTRSVAIDRLLYFAVLLGVHKSPFVAQAASEVLTREFDAEMIRHVTNVHDHYLGYSTCVNFYQALLRV